MLFPKKRPDVSVLVGLLTSGSKEETRELGAEDPHILVTFGEQVQVSVDDAAAHTSIWWSQGPEVVPLQHVMVLYCYNEHCRK
jgi:hypothetical protein